MLDTTRQKVDSALRRFEANLRTAHNTRNELSAGLVGKSAVVAAHSARSF